jgi:methylene-fatty-acyl-phospholipid synthase
MNSVLHVTNNGAGSTTAAALVVAAALLSLERLFYLWVWNQPEQLAAWCGRQGMGAPVVVLERACIFFKLLQALVFVWWCTLHGSELMWPEGGALLARICGATLVLAGQFLNYSVFRRLGRVGVFYGIRFGHRVRWSTEFPFSVLKHPQYVGALLSIWGFFLLARFPHDDWFLLPALETLYYSVGAYLER